MVNTAHLWHRHYRLCYWWEVWVGCYDVGGLMGCLCYVIFKDYQECNCKLWLQFIERCCSVCSLQFCLRLWLSGHYQENDCKLPCALVFWLIRFMLCCVFVSLAVMYKGKVFQQDITNRQPETGGLLWWCHTLIHGLQRGFQTSHLL